MQSIRILTKSVKQEVKIVTIRNLLARNMSTLKFQQALSGPFNFVGNERCEPVGSAGTCTDTGSDTFDNLEPRTYKVLSKVGISGAEEVNRAVGAAKCAFREWSRMSGFERGRILTRAAHLLRENLDEIAVLEVKDNGKPIWEAKMDMETVISAFEYFGGVAPSMVGQHVKLPSGSFAYVSKEPFGVVGGIGAWNYPLQTCAWKVAPALACGNTFVYKPSPLTPVTAVVLGEILRESGLPSGVFNVVQGLGDTGSVLSSHPDVAKLSFTGSTPTGTKIMQAGAVGIRNVTLELGGKSPLIVFDDADLKNAVKGALMANFFTQGEVCSNAARVFVQGGILNRFLPEFIRQAKLMKIGDPLDSSTTVGATISKEHAEKVLAYIKGAVKEGATVATGGQRVEVEGECSGGFFLSPCILTNCHDDMVCVKEEIFGSVATILPFETEEEVIRRANNTPYGLSGGVFTRDLARAHRVCNELEAGSLWINTYNICPSEVPFGGFKMSGIGRENGPQVLESYTQTKTVYVEMNDIDCGQLYQD